MSDIEHKVKIGISGNALGAGGYFNLINVGFDDVVVNRQVSFKGQADAEYSIEVQQGADEAVFVLVANPLTVYSYGASRAGALCIFLSIPARTYFKEEFTPLTLLRRILQDFREKNMTQKGEVWEYQYKAFYDRKPFVELSEKVKQYLAELPTYVPMNGVSELLVSIGSNDRLEKFFSGDFQYPDFRDCSRLIIADYIMDGISWENEVIPRAWSLEVKYNSNKVAELHNSNDELHSIKIILEPHDKDCYKPTEISLWLDGYKVKTKECIVQKTDWGKNEVLIDKINWINNDRFVPICVEGIDTNLSPEDIVCTFDATEIHPDKKPDEVLGFTFWGPQILSVKDAKFDVNNDSYNFVFNLKTDDKGLPEELYIKAELKPKLEEEPTQEPTQEPNETDYSQTIPGGNPEDQGSSYDSTQGGSFAQARAQNERKGESDLQSYDQEQSHNETEKKVYTFTNETGETLVISRVECATECGNTVTVFENFSLENGCSKDIDLQKLGEKKLRRLTIHFKKKYEKLEKEILDANSESRIESCDLRLRLYRQPVFLLGVRVGAFGTIALGLVIFCAVWLISILPESNEKALLSFKLPEEKVDPSLFIYDSVKLDKAIHLYASCRDDSDEIKQKKDSILSVITKQVERFKTLLYELEDKNYPLTFDDPQKIQKWIDKPEMCHISSQITDIDTLKKYCPLFVSSGSLIKTILNGLEQVVPRDYVKSATEENYKVLKDNNDNLKGDQFKPIRMCLQGFFSTKFDTKNTFTLYFQSEINTKPGIREYNSFAQIKHHFDNIAQ